jgi:gliding motility-associated-like protein
MITFLVKNWNNTPQVFLQGKRLKLLISQTLSPLSSTPKCALLKTKIALSDNAIHYKAFILTVKAPLVLLLWLLNYAPQLHAKNNYSLDTGQTLAKKGIEKKIKSHLDRSSVRFIENKGQITDMQGKPATFVMFKAEAPGVTLYVTQQGLTYQFIQSEKEDQKEELQEKIHEFRKRQTKIKNKGHEYRCSRIDMQLMGASIRKENMLTEKPSVHHYNYFLSHCPEGIYDVKEYEKITFRNVYPGIDWVLYNSDKKGFKYDFIVHPSAEPKNIELVYLSQQKPRLGSNGNIYIENDYGVLNEQAPFCYVKENKSVIPSKFKVGNSQKIEGHYETKVRFNLQQNLPTEQTLVIDPQLFWSTLYGGSLVDGPCCLDADSLGNLFAVGYTESANFPLLNNGNFFQSTFNSPNSQNAHFMMKYSPTGALLWCTYYGQEQFQGNINVVTDRQGNVFMAGGTVGGPFPVQNTGNYFQSVLSGYSDGYLVKFNNNGLRLWATLFGGSDAEDIISLDVDLTGNVFVLGNTFSSDLPLLNNGNFFTGNLSGTINSFIAKFTNGGILQWSTYFGSDGLSMSDVKCAPSGNVYFAGSSIGSVVVPTLNPGSGAWFSGTQSGPGDAYLARFSNSGLLQWSTFYGGFAGENFSSLETAPNGDLYVLGYTESPDFPLLNAGGYFKSTLGGTPGSVGDICLLKFNSNLVRQWATFLGGSDFEFLQTQDQMALDTCGTLYVSFDTFSTDVTTLTPCDGGYFTGTKFGGATSDVDNFIMRFSPQTNLLWATYFGGLSGDFRSALAVNRNNNQLYLTGEWCWTSTLNPGGYSLVNPGNGAYFDTLATITDEGFLAGFRKVNAVGTSFNYNGPYCTALQFTPAPTSSTGFLTGGTYSSAQGLSLNPSTGQINLASSAPGTYTVTYSVGSSTCTCSIPVQISSTLSITQGAQLIITPVSPTLCGGNSSTLFVQTASVALLNYTWQPSGTNAASISITPIANTVYTVTALDTTSCSSTATVQVTVSSPTVTVQGSKTLCRGESVILSGVGALTYIWSTGAAGTSVSLNPQNTATYSMVGSDAAGCQNTSIFQLTVNPLPTVTVNSPTICTNAQATLVATAQPQDNVSFFWLPGSVVGDSLVANPISATVYSVYANLNGCIAIQTSTISLANELQPITSFSYKGPFCKTVSTATPAFITGFNTGGVFISAQGLVIDSLNGVIVPTRSEAGTYTVNYEFEPQSCITAGMGSALVEIKQGPNLGLVPRIILAPGTSTILLAQGANSYSWSPSEGLSCILCSTPRASVSESQRFCVEAQDAFCVSKACVDIEVSCDANLSLTTPNAFTPNGDGENDNFCLLGWNFCTKDFQVLIFNRWGEKVFESNNPDFCWDGRFRGQLLSSDVFVYSIKATFENNKEVTKKGNITLVR